MDTVRDILTNVILLFGLIVIITIPNRKVNRNSLWHKILLGLLIGLFTIIIMINAFELHPGLIFDTRSVMIGVTALFFSPLTALIATALAIGFRVYVGGFGLLPGVLTLFSSLVIGLLWRRYLLNNHKINRHLSFYLFGLAVHVAMLTWMLTLPYPTSLEVLENVGPIVIIVYPVAVMMFSLIITNHEERITAHDVIRNNEKKYRTLVDNNMLGIIQYDLNGVIQHSNQAAAEILGVTVNQLQNLDMTTLPNKKLVAALESSFDGESVIYEDIYVSYISGKQFDARAKFSPIVDNGVMIGGLCIIEDLTDQKAMQRDIELLRQTDILTGLYNRAAFDEFLMSVPDASAYPITIGSCDINTFQIINTSFGYEIGNLVLVSISKIITESIHGMDNVRAYRIGGDEFGMVLSNTPEDQALVLLESIQKKIKNIHDYNFDISISCGTATSLDAGTPLSEVLNQSLANMMTNKLYDGSSISIKTIDLIMNTLFEKNPREKNHSERVSRIARRIAEEFHLGTAFSNRTELAGRLHDIGKITMADDVLDKPGKLTEREWLRIHKHPESGFKILSSVPEYLDVANVVFAHHERWDGAGYPRGLKGNQTPLEARIIMVADAFDAMTVSRPYRSAMTSDVALAEIKRNAGTQFDPQVVKHLVNLIETGEL